MKNPQLLGDTDKYNIEISDFSTQFDKFIFSAIYNLFIDGAEQIHTIDIDNYLQSNVVAKNLIEKENGIQFLQDCEFYGETSNFSHYYNRFKKINLLRDLQKSGKDINKFYSENEFDEKHLEINEKFEELKVEDIVNSLKNEIANYESKYVLNNTVEELNAVDGVRNLIKNLKETPEVGVHLQGEIFNTITRGGRKGRLYVRSAGSGVGKAIPNDTVIPTPDGFKRVDEIKVGDYLFDRLGKPTKVLAIYPQKNEKEIFEVHFKSGRVAKCCEEHLWSYYNGNEFVTSSLKEILNKNLNNIAVPTNKPVQYKEKFYLIKPFEIGILVGRGNIDSIPKEYLLGSIEQRTNLLAGVLCAAAALNESKKPMFSIHSENLQENILSLCRSLGIGLDVNETWCGGAIKYCNTLNSVNKEIKNKLIKLTKFLNISFENLVENSKDLITSIVSTKKLTKMTCFYVDNDEHLFLMNDYIVTHNTRSMVGDACNIAYPIRFDNNTGQWVSTGSCEKVLYVMTEQDPAEIQTMILSYLSGYNEELFLYGTYNESHMDRINKAIEIMEKYKDNMLLARIPDPCASVVKNLFRRYSYTHGVEIFFYDYIFSSPAMLSEYRDLKLREDVCLRMFTTCLKNLALELNAFVLTSTQISNDDDKNNGFKDFRNIQGSKAIVNLADFACIMSRPSVEELKLIEGFSNQFNITPNCVTDIFKNRQGRWTMIRLWSINDLGTCTKKDLFVTTHDMKPITDFQIIDFNSTNESSNKEIQDLIDKFNVNSVINYDNVDEILDRIDSAAPPSVSNKIKEAFGDSIEEKKRLKDMDWSDFI